MTLQPISSPNSLEARTPAGELRIHISGTWLWAYDHKIHRWVESTPYGIEIGGAPIEPIRWKKLQCSHAGNP
jgi:hypothetical protein